MRFKLNEELLLEKQWVEVEVLPTGFTPNTFYFYANDSSPTSDVNTLMPLIDKTQTGTYKQSINRTLLRSLQSHFNTHGAAFSLHVIRTGVPDTVVNAAPPATIMTLTDRALRRTGNSTATNATGLPGKFLVHHKDGHEGNNATSNLLACECNNINEEICAVAAHKAAHNLGNLTGITAATPYTQSIDIYEDNGHGFAVTHTLTVTIT